MSVHSGSHDGNEYASPQHFNAANPTGTPHSGASPITQRSHEVHIPMESINTRMRVNLNYTTEHSVQYTISSSDAHPIYSSTHTSASHMYNAHDAFTRPTMAISQPIIHTSATPMTYKLSEPCEQQATQNFNEQFSQPAAMSVPQSAHVYYKSLNLASLNIKYTGDSNVDEFLLRLNETRLARQIDDATLVRGFAELLSGTALKFYRTVRCKLTSWSDICSEFRKYFQSKDHSYNIERQIRELKQQPGQSVSFFILDVQDLNSRLNFPILQSNLLEIVKHNLLSSYAQLLAINDITSFEQLVNVSKNFEAYSGVLQHPKPSGKREVNAVAGAMMPSRRDRSVTCLKCKKFGHGYRVCRSVPGVICFNCGARGVLTKDCSACATKSRAPSTPALNKKN